MSALDRTSRKATLSRTQPKSGAPGSTKRRRLIFLQRNWGQEFESPRAHHPSTLAKHNEALRPVLRHAPAPSLVFGRSRSRRASPWLNEFGHRTSLPITGAGATRGREGEPNNLLGFRQIGPAPSF